MRTLFAFVILVLLSTPVHSQWVRTSGPYGGTIECFASNATHTFAGTEDGIYRSSNNGISWMPVSSGLTNRIIRALLVNGTRIYAGSLGGNIFVSTNNGDSWTEVGAGSIAEGILAFAVNGTNLFAGTAYGGVYRSGNNGSTWTPVNNGLGNLFINALILDGTKLYASTYSGIYASTNNGTSWQAAGLASAYATSLAISGGYLCVGAMNTSFSNGGVYRSSNGGTTWYASASAAGNVHTLLTNGSYVAGSDPLVSAASTPVRAATETDIPAVAAVHEATFPRQLDSTTWIERNFRAYPRIAYFIAERDGAVIGFIEWIQKSGFRKEAVLELEQLADQPPFQGQGIGTALIAESIAQMDRLLKQRNARIKSVMVTTRTDNQAQELYRKVLRAEPQAVIKDLYSADEVILLARDMFT